MACSLKFIESLCDALAPLGEVRSRKMMGEYVIYVNGKCVITACDNIAYVKKLPCIVGMMADDQCSLDFADIRRTLKVIETLWNDLPFPKSKKK